MVEWKGALAYLAPCKGIRNPGLENPNYNLRNPESHLSSESDIQVLLTKNPESNSRNPESIAWNPEFMTVLHSLTWDDLHFQNLALTLPFISLLQQFYYNLIWKALFAKKTNQQINKGEN